MLTTAFRNWLRGPRRRTIRNSPPPSNRARLGGFQRLEDRTVPTVNVLDLTAGIGESGVLNGATYTSVDPQPTGTGYIDPFLRIQRNPSNPSGMEHGYNTDGVEEFDAKDAGGHNWNHSLKLADLQTVNGFYIFTLDVNETKPGALISLDELQIFVQNSPDLTGATFKDDGSGTIESFRKPKANGSFTTVAANLVYDMDGSAQDGDSSVLLNYFLNHGSGSGDMTVAIPASLFTGGKFVYLYSKFGQDVEGAGAEAGFEEWTALLRRGGGGGDQYSLSGHKIEDMNGDGDITGDPPIQGWTVYLYKEVSDPANGWTADDEFIGSTTTDVNGYYEFTGLESDKTYYTVEALPDGWVQTFGGNTENGANDYYTTLLNSDIIDLDFGNFQLGSIHGLKVRDCDANGYDEGDEPLANWIIFLDGSNGGTVNGVLDAGELSTTTDANGEYSFDNLFAGTYYVREVIDSLPGNWIQTDGGADVTIASGQEYVAYSGQADLDPGQEEVVEEGLAFANVELGAGGGHTPGFWSNNNGFNQLMDGGTLEPELEMLRSYNLKDNDGNDFDPQTYAELEAFLVGSTHATAVNMAAALSRHLAAMILNVEAGFVDPNALVYAPGVGNTGVNDDFISIADLIAQADDALEADGYTPSGDVNRAYQEMLKNALGNANENSNFVVC